MGCPKLTYHEDTERPIFLGVWKKSDGPEKSTNYQSWGSVLREQKYDPDQFYKWGYQGQYSELDPETNWNHFELREYDAVTGRMTTTDPYGQYFSSYTGMGNNPINGVDPDGGLFGKWRAERWARKHGGEAYQDEVTGRWWGEAQIENGVWAKDFGKGGLGFSLRDADNFVAGVNNAIITNHTMGIGRQDFDDAAFQNGQLAGDFVSVLMGLGEMAGGTTMAAGGGTVTVLSGGTLGVVGVPAVGLGSAIAVEGAATTGVALGNVMVHFARKRNKNKSSAESDYGKESAEHVNNARPSTLNRHQKGQARKGKDRGGEKGDARRKRYK
jgi:RHS repeat-associated protein